MFLLKLQQNQNSLHLSAKRRVPPPRHCYMMCLHMGLFVHCRPCAVLVCGCVLLCPARRPAAHAELFPLSIRQAQSVPRAIHCV